MSNETGIADRARDHAAAASRARGALILAAFGSCWLAGGISVFGNSPGSTPMATAMLASVSLVVAGAVLIFAWRSDQQLRPFARPWSPEIRRGFIVVNVLQYVALGLIAAFFTRGDLQQWIIPLGMVVVGLHFLPLARMFHSPPHAWIGAAMLVAAALVALSRQPAFGPVGILSGGGVLLAGAAYLICIARRALSA